MTADLAECNNVDAPVFNFRRNDPAEFETLEKLIGSAEALHFVWPGARFPLVHSDWVDWMERSPRPVSYYVDVGGETVGHAGIFGSKDPMCAHIAWLFLSPHLRGEGMGQKFIQATEREALKRPGIRRLTLRTNSFNPRALHIYKKHHYQVTETHGDTIEMMKELV